MNCFVGCVAYGRSSNSLEIRGLHVHDPLYDFPTLFDTEFKPNQLTNEHLVPLASHANSRNGYSPLTSLPQQTSLPQSLIPSTTPFPHLSTRFQPSGIYPNVHDPEHSQ
jgi:hypothetical protein